MSASQTRWLTVFVLLCVCSGSLSFPDAQMFFNGFGVLFAVGMIAIFTWRTARSFKEKTKMGRPTFSLRLTFEDSKDKP